MINQKNQKSRFRLLSYIFICLGGLITIVLSIMFGTLILSVETMFDHILSTEKLQRPIVMSPPELPDQNFDFDTHTLPIDETHKGSQNKVIPINDYIDNRNFDAPVNDWKNHRDLEGAEKDKIDENHTTYKRLSAAEEEIRMLQEALPENTLIPVKRSEQELSGFLQGIKEQKYLQTLINSKEAAPSDLRHYYDLQAKKFEDEIALIDFCQKILANENSAEDVPFCTIVALDGKDKRKANEKSLEQLRRNLL